MASSSGSNLAARQANDHFCSQNKYFSEKAGGGRLRTLEDETQKVADHRKRVMERQFMLGHSGPDYTTHNLRSMVGYEADARTPMHYKKHQEKNQQTQIKINVRKPTVPQSTYAEQMIKPVNADLATKHKFPSQNEQACIKLGTYEHQKELKSINGLEFTSPKLTIQPS